MEKISILSKETLIPLTLVITIVSFVVGTVAYIVKGTVKQEQFETRLQKNEEIDSRQDSQIQDIKSNSLVFTEVLKQINEKLGDLKKSIEIIQSQQMKNN